MGKIFCIMGKSASGKDTIYNALLQSEALDLQRVILYTTRPIRSGEKDGETYFFCTDERACEMEQTGKVIEMRSYDTMHGVWKYFTADDGQMDLQSDKQYLMIGTLEAYGKVREYFGPDAVIPLFIHVDDGLRLARAVERERRQAEPKYAELCRRFLADEADFSEEKKQAVGITEVFENTCLADTVAEIIAYMKGVC